MDPNSSEWPETGDAAAAFKEMLPDYDNATDGCPSLERLTDFADGSLRASEVKCLRRHLACCTACASIALDLRKEFGSVRAMHEGWFGWKGAVLYALAPRTDGDTARRWRAHRARCEACDRRTERVTGLLGDGIARYGGSFALGAACTLLVMVSIGLPRTPGTSAAPPSSNLNDRTTEVSKGAPPPPAATDQGWMDAQQTLGRFIHPADYQLPAVVRYWEQASSAHPSDAAPLAALRDLYARMYVLEKDPMRQAEIAAKRKVTDHRLTAIIDAGSLSREVPNR